MNIHSMNPPATSSAATPNAIADKAMATRTRFRLRFLMTSAITVSSEGPGAAGSHPVYGRRLGVGPVEILYNGPARDPGLARNAMN